MYKAEKRNIILFQYFRGSINTIQRSKTRIGKDCIYKFNQ